MRAARWLLLAAAAQVQALPLDAGHDAAPGWRGAVVPPYPSGWRQLGGSCVGQGGPEAMCTTMVSVLRDEQSGIRMLLATRPLRHVDGTSVGDERRPLELVTDALEPAALDDARAEASIGLCRRDGRDDARIVAIVRPDADVQWFVPQRAWRLDEAGHFQPIPVEGVRCRNEGDGYDG